MESDTYQKIISSASACFSDKGFCATSIGDISRRANISQGAMYRHFRGKDDLIVAIVKEEVKSALAFYSEPYECSSLERVFQIAKTCIMKSGYPINPSLWIEVIAESSRNTDVNSYFLLADRAMRDALKKVIQDGIKKGEFKSIDPEEVSIFLFAILDGLIARRAVDPKFDLEEGLPSFQRVVKGILNI